MTRRILILVAIAAGLFAATNAAAIEPTTVARSIEPGMVRIVLEGPNPDEKAVGSGFVVNHEGYVATAHHVIQPHLDADWKISVIESGAAPDSRRGATVVKSYPEEDLAVLKVEGLRRPPLTLSESSPDTLIKGTTIFAIGYPGAGERLGADTGTSFTAGIANRIFVGAWAPDAPRILIVQHSAATNPGNSGGPIVNACGQVVGMNTEREMAMIITPSGLPIVYDVIQGVFFASHVSVLTVKLEALGVPYSGSSRVCRVILGVASTNFLRYGIAASVLSVLLLVLAIRYWPRRVVQVIVVRDAAGLAGPRRLGERLLHPRWLTHRRAPQWRLRSDDVGGRPLDIVISPEDLKRFPDGFVVGSDPDCDCCLVADGIADRHARLQGLGEDLGISDLNSGHETKVDDRPVDPADGPATLRPGARLRLGDLVFRVDRR